jgi:ABC-type antimicrobial peptide transport system permease subunit
MVGYLVGYLSGMGLSVGMLFIMLLVMVWDLVWKLLAMWKSAKRNSAVWFAALLLFNTAGILPILYIYVFSEMNKSKSARKSRKVRRKRR